MRIEKRVTLDEASKILRLSRKTLSNARYTPGHPLHDKFVKVGGKVLLPLTAVLEYGQLSPLPEEPEGVQHV